MLLFLSRRNRWSQLVSWFLFIIIFCSLCVIMLADCVHRSWRSNSQGDRGEGGAPGRKEGWTAVSSSRYENTRSKEKEAKLMCVLVWTFFPCFSPHSIISSRSKNFCACFQDTLKNNIGINSFIAKPSLSPAHITSLVYIPDCLTTAMADTTKTFPEFF